MRNIEDYLEKYKQSNFEDIQVAFRMKKILEIIQQYTHNSVLEIGCGLEPFFKFFDDYTQMTVIDPCEEFIINAKELSVDNSRIRCIQGFFEDQIPLLEKTKYDFVILSSLLHELEDPSNLLNKLKNICNHQTIIHVNVPNAYSFHRVLAKEMGLIEDVFKKSDRQMMLQQNRTFCLKSLSELLNNAGLKILDSGSYFVKPFTHDQMYRMLTSGFIDTTVLEGLYNIVKYMPEYGSEIYVNCKFD